MPNIFDVNFNDIEDVVGYATLLIAEANDMGIFAMTHSKQSVEVIRLKANAQKWVNAVKRHLATCPIGEGLRLIDLYEVIHRLAYDKPGDSRMLSEYKLRAFHAYISQDRTIDQYVLFGVIDNELRRRNPLFLGAPLDWLNLSIERWIENFRTRRRIRDLSDYDIIRQITILLLQDLWAFEPDQDRFKRRLFDAYSRYLDLTDSITPPQMSALRQLLYASVSYLTPSAWAYYDKILSTALLSNPTTNRYYRQSLRLQMKKAG